MQDGEVGIVQMMAELVDEVHQLGGENRLQTVRELLRISNAAMEGLMRLGAVRTHNAPIEGVAELIACECLDLTLAARNQEGFDATDAEGLRYQIKGICTDKNTGRTSPIREGVLARSANPTTSNTWLWWSVPVITSSGAF